MDFFKAYEEFMFECDEKNAWTKATFQKMYAMREDYKAFKKNLKFSDLTENLSSSTKRNRGEEFEPGGFADCL